METLERALREAADLAPDGLAVDESGWSAESWRRGRRRRRLRQAAGGAGMAAVLLVVTGLLLSLTVGVPRASMPADGGDEGRSGVSSFPQRIGHQWWVRDLPARPGPLAGMVEVVADEGDPGSWQAVTPGGTRYWIPQDPMAAGTYPTLSADGTRLGRVGPDGTYLVTDTVSGRVTGFPDLGTSNLVPGSDDAFVGGRRYGVQMQSPGWFSPSGSRLALLASGPDSFGGTVVLAEDGSVTPLDGLDQPAGWLDDDRLLGRLLPEVDAGSSEREVRLAVWDRRTGRAEPIGAVALPDRGTDVLVSLRGQFWGSLRSDGTLWVTTDLTGPDQGSGSAEVLGYDVRTLRPVDLSGRPLAEPLAVPVDAEVPTGPQQWRGDVPLSRTADGVRAVWARGDVLSVVQGDAVTVQQVVFARKAINGTPSWTPFGTTDLLVLWWWKEAALAALGLILWRWWVRTRPNRRPADAATPRPVVGS